MIQLAKPITPTEKVRSEEAEALRRLHGYTKKQALETVGLDPRRFRKLPSGKIKYLPTPELILQSALAIRDGDVFVNPGSYDRWAAIRATRSAAVEREPDDFELAGRIPDDDVELPAWLYSADRQG
tara:strand:+ start:2565 stop:2942 length:378 start_codon:yes stop_codon:yes gene_type:complete